MGTKEFTKIQNELDQNGFVTEIKKVGFKEYNLILNFEVYKIRKQRRSCKAHIIKLYEKNKHKWS
ncbi:MAG: hypothetical protein WAQ28_03430 [Bacteroidia bacterium]